ncbi:MAG: phosphoribosylformylglycinamidine synthase subunit PurQ [Proteobacteria bacterium]|nr:phosphoribosylformylglycinamidine synthase subunit PurQ [Pseudomonadota bacterium]
MAKCIVLTGFGINCEQECLWALELAGAKNAEIVHISQILEGEKKLNNYQFIVFPGGFLDGDDLGSAKVQVNRFTYAKIKSGKEKLIDSLLSFIEKGNLALGICNGFQFMVKAGIIPNTEKKHSFKQETTLTFNDSGRFEDRWVYLKVNKNSPCIFTNGIDTLYLPVRHGEGKFYCDEKTLNKIEANNLFVLQYSNQKLEPTMEYPYNPNGSLNAIAGICDTTGRLFGLMPHPEAFIYPYHHPRWTREKIEEADGLKIFKNALKYLA